MAKTKVAVTAWMFGTGGVAAELAGQGEIAEKIGFDSFWLPESHFGGDTSIPSPLMLLAAVSARTSKIRLGSTSYLLPIRHPIQAAEEVAVLDRLSNGRVILGVGRGFQDTMYTVFDVPIKDKRKRFKANLEIMIAAWQGKPVAEDGDGTPAYLAPLPVQKPHPPIWVAAFGPLAIKQAGTLGLPYIASPVETMASLQENYSLHKEHSERAGHSEIDTTPVMRTLFISEHKQLVSAVRENLKKEAAHRMRKQATSVDDWAIIGDINYVSDKISEYEETLGLNYLIARGRIPGVSNDSQIASLEQLAKITGL
ncbi:MAG: LLM class flavin-dependent oxidoreductase [Proteobacteria bacterium]|nr:LLM class flavin-dependent oxidoreductase [Pseudomonadota bacterium]